jgi:hypothetical protein
MNTRNSSLVGVVLVLGLMVLGAACAHAPAAQTSPIQPAIADAHRVGDWTGVVRIAVGSYELLDSSESGLVESTVTGLISGVGADVKVSCLEHEGALGNGVVHARVRLQFPERMTLEQKFTTLGLLQGLNPTGEAYRFELPLTGSVRGPSAPLARRRAR